MGPTWGPSGADRTQVAPCWPHELCYLGYYRYREQVWSLVHGTYKHTYIQYMTFVMIYVFAVMYLTSYTKYMYYALVLQNKINGYIGVGLQQPQQFLVPENSSFISIVNCAVYGARWYPSHLQHEAEIPREFYPMIGPMCSEVILLVALL